MTKIEVRVSSEIIEDWQSREETLEILSKPTWVESIEEGLRASEKGETVRWRDKKFGK
ncbi:MAG: hypothetical protein HQL05_06665 [Nitrospirae bacterium]|uniref:hypothetical protein n=1 Tax=Candidatus Magnetobacterium casense TaxID=1455061 RepID=UPI0012DFC8F3|nr:hypothetical protein [Candidatus Magnetobacterium casensis]MBF0337500.1 hypothetical protein [Nitrospirota bacterium]